MNDMELVEARSFQRHIQHLAHVFGEYDTDFSSAE